MFLRVAVVYMFSIYSSVKMYFGICLGAMLMSLSEISNWSKMSAYVLLILLIELEKRDQIRRLPSILGHFSQRV